MQPVFGTAAILVAPPAPLLSTGYVPGNTVAAQHLNFYLYHLTKELNNLLAAAGLSQSTADDTQVTQAVKVFMGPIGAIMMIDANNAGGGSGGASGPWVDNVTIPGWYACIAANAIYGCPDLTSHFIKGKAVAGAGSAGGSNTHTIASAELPPHIHGVIGNTQGESVVHHHSTGDGTPFLTGGNGRQIPGLGSGIGAVFTTGPENESHIHYFAINSGDGGFANTPIDMEPSYYSVIYVRRCF